MTRLESKSMTAGCLRSWCLSVLAFALAVTVASAASPHAAPAVRKEAPFFTASVDGAGNLTTFVVKPFQDDLLRARYLPKDETLERLGGLIFGPIGRVAYQAQPQSRKTTDGGRVMSDPTGTWLPREIEVERHYQFSETTYVVDVEVTLRNTSDRTVPLSSSAGELAFWLGPVLQTTQAVAQEIVAARDGDVIEVLSSKAELQSAPAGTKWIGARESYFCAALQENKGRGTYFHQLVQFEQPKGQAHQGVLIGFRYQYPELRSRESVTLFFRVYLGPKVEENLTAAGYPRMFNNWEGFTGGIGKLMFHMLHVFYAMTGSYGVAILLLTLLVKVVLHPLNLKQLRSMQKLQMLQPKMQDLKKRYPDPREFQTEVQKLYIENQVNPLGGCFPILLQIPIFIALYSCLMGAIELKKVRFLWLPDLAMPDPLALLPILFAGSIYVSSKMTSTTTPMDKSQQTMMQIMPIMMLMFMVNVPAGVMLYLAGQSILSLFETKWNQAIMKQEEDQKKARKADRQKKRSKKESHEAEESVS